MARKTRTVRSTRSTKLNAATAMQKARASVRKTLTSIAKQGAAFQAASTERVDQARARTVAAVSSLEKVFEQRVGRAIAKMGVPTTKDVRALSRQVAELQAKVDRMSRSRARA